MLYYTDLSCSLLLTIDDSGLSDFSSLHEPLVLKMTLADIVHFKYAFTYLHYLCCRKLAQAQCIRVAHS